MDWIPINFHSIFPKLLTSNVFEIDQIASIVKQTRYEFHMLDQYFAIKLARNSIHKPIHRNIIVLRERAYLFLSKWWAVSSRGSGLKKSVCEYFSLNEYSPLFCVWFIPAYPCDHITNLIAASSHLNKYNRRRISAFFQSHSLHAFPSHFETKLLRNILLEFLIT